MGTSASPGRRLGNRSRRTSKDPRSRCWPSTHFSNVRLRGDSSMSNSIDVGGIALGPGSDLVGLLRKQMLEGSVWSVFRDQGPEEGLDLAMEAVRSTDLEAPMTQAVMQLLTDPDVTVRTRAIWLAKNYAPRFDSIELLDLLENRSDLFVGVRPKVGSNTPDLSWGLLQAMLGQPSASDAVRTRLRQAVLDPRDGSKLLATLTRADTNWVLGNSLELANANPLNAGIILANLDSSQRRRFVGSFAGAPIATRESIKSAIDSKVPDPEEQEALRRLVGEER